MNPRFHKRENYIAYALILVLMCAFAFGLKGVDIVSSRQEAGWINFALGGMLLAAFVIAKLVRALGLPLLTGYIFAGILAGPFVSGFLSVETVARLKLIDELALSIIALAAGAELKLAAMRKRGKAIIYNILLITVLVFAVVAAFILSTGGLFNVTSGFSAAQLTAFAILIGVICVARSPSSTIAVINECRADGPFTETILSVTMVTDILIIIMFTIALSISQQVIHAGGGLQWHTIGALTGEIAMSLLIGAVLGKGLTLYIQHVKHDFLMFLVFVAFGVTRMSMGFNQLMDIYAHISLHLEPLLICMSAGFVVRNFGASGPYFLESLDRIAMPVYVLFFSLAGAALNFKSLLLCWPLAVALVVVRAGGLFAGSWLAGRINRDPVPHQYCAWMTYLTQAGVAIGLAQLAMREFPEVGTHLNTVVLALIAINQLVGPVLFKAALYIVKEAGSCRQ